jgi:hypothetical protein
MRRRIPRHAARKNSLGKFSKKINVVLIECVHLTFFENILLGRSHFQKVLTVALLKFFRCDIQFCFASFKIKVTKHQTQPPAMSVNDKEYPLNNFVIDNSDKSVQDILNKLCLLAKLQPGEKVDVTNISLQQSSWLTSLWRTISGGEQSRERTLRFIQSITDDALMIIEKCLSSCSDVHNLLGVETLKKLDSAICGINNLYETYKDDRYFTAKLETQLLLLKVKIENIKLRYNK